MNFFCLKSELFKNNYYLCGIFTIIKTKPMASYYDSNKATSANSRYFILNGSDEQHFPFEDLYIGSLSGGEMELPAS